MPAVKSLSVRTLLVWGLACGVALAGLWRSSAPAHPAVAPEAAVCAAGWSPSADAAARLSTQCPLSGAARLTLRLPININTASAHDLEALPGIGPILAARIVDYRAQHGPFTEPHDLLNVHRIGPVTLARLQEAGIVTAVESHSTGRVNALAPQLSQGGIP